MALENLVALADRHRLEEFGEATTLGLLQAKGSGSSWNIASGWPKISRLISV